MNPPALGLQVLDRRSPCTDAAAVLGHWSEGLAGQGGSRVKSKRAAQNMGSAQQMGQQQWSAVGTGQTSR